MANLIQVYKKVISTSPKQQQIVELNVYRDKDGSIKVFTHNDDSKECAEGVAELIRKYGMLTLCTWVTGKTLNRHIQERIKEQVEQLIPERLLVKSDGDNQYPSYVYCYFGD